MSNRSYRVTGLPRTRRMRWTGVTGLIMKRGDCRAEWMRVLAFRVSDRVALWLAHPRRFFGEGTL